MPKAQSFTIPTQFVRATVQKDSFDPDRGTFDLTFATETPVFRQGWDENYNEVLTCDPANIRLERAAGGLPLLNAHPDYSGRVKPEDVMGKISDIRCENRSLVGTATLGANATPQVRSDIQNGILDTFSVGYNIYKGTRVDMGKDATPTYQMTDWEPNHVAIAPIPADYNSKKRSDTFDGHPITIDNYLPYKTHPHMLKTIAEIRAQGTDEQKARLEAILQIAATARLTEERSLELFESDKTIEAIRTEHPATAAPTMEPPQRLDVESIRAQGSLENKKRLEAILVSTRAAGLSDTRAIELFSSERSIEEIRQAIITEYVSQDTRMDGNHTMTLGKEAIDKKRELAMDALANRIKPDTFKLSAPNEYRELTLIEIVKEFAAERGMPLKGKGRQEIADMVFSGRRDLSTSDFPLLLEQLADKLLRQDYVFAPEYWGMIAKETSVRDFKPKNLYQVESQNGMQAIPEGDELKYTSLVEGKQTISVQSYAEGVKFTRRSFINDDLNAFALIPNRFALDWNTLRGDLVWNLLINNAKMYDGVSLFDAKHSNVLAAGAASALSDTALAAGLLLFRRQTALNGKRRIRVIPKFLIVAPEMEIPARKLLQSIFATKTGDVNLWENAYTLIVEPRLQGNAWYLAAEPGEIDGLYYCYLDGNSGLRSNRVDDFDTDSIKFAVRGEFGTQAIDYRGWIMSPGQ
jgi:hypothetical protein